MRDFGKGGRKQNKLFLKEGISGLKSDFDGGGEWAVLLRAFFAAPPPLQKQHFLRHLPRRRISGWQFVLGQAAYIRKWAWALSLGVFLAALAGVRFLGGEAMWMLAAMMPLLAVSLVTEYARSEVCGMTELEMSARFGLKMVTLARMGILGAVHFGTLCFLSVLGREGGGSMFRTGIYLLVPYLATDVAALWVIRRLRGREGLYACLGLSLVVGAAPVLLRYAGSLAIWQTGDFGRWLWAAGILGAAAALQWKRSIERTEELTWN